MDAILCISFAPIFARPNLPTNGRSTFAALNKHKKARTKGKKMAVKKEKRNKKGRSVGPQPPHSPRVIKRRDRRDMSAIGTWKYTAPFFFSCYTLHLTHRFYFSNYGINVPHLNSSPLFFLPHNVHLSYSLYYHYFYHHISLCFRCCHWRWCYYYFHIRFLRYECWKFTLCYKYYDIIITLITELQFPYTEIRVL